MNNLSNRQKFEAAFAKDWGNPPQSLFKKTLFRFKNLGYPLSV